MRQLLILSCTKRKRQDPGLLPAVDRYDEPSFRLLRRFREHGLELPDVFVLSARYGLIHYEKPIPDYEVRVYIRTLILLKLKGVFAFADCRRYYFEKSRPASI